MHQNHEESHTQGKILECVVMIVCMFPYVYTHVSLCLNSYVLMLQCMCPHASMQVSLCLNMFVLMFECMCPHVSFFRSKSRSKRQATRHRWGQVRQQIPDTLAVLKINIDGKEGRKRFNFVKNVVKIFNEFIPPEELLFLDRCEQLERAIETVNLEIPVTDLFFDGQYHVSLCFDADVLMLFLHVSICFCACVLMLTSLCPYVFCMCPYAFLHVSLSLSGDVTRTVEFFRPIVQILYDMPEMRPEHGSEKWMSYMKKNMYQATFENLARYPELLRIFIRDMKKRGTKEGFPNLISGDSMTWSKYVPLKPSSLPSKLSPRVNTKHTYLQFLRSINLYVLMLSCMCPYVWMNVSLCLNSCVLMLYCMCPHSSMHASLCLNVCVLMFECMCPHVLTRVLLYIYP